MYPSLAGLIGRGRNHDNNNSGGASSSAAEAPPAAPMTQGRPPVAPPSTPAAAAAAAAAADASPWSADSHSMLRVRIADEYRLDPLVTVPPSLEASAGDAPREFDFDYERRVMAAEGGGASAVIDALLAKPEEGFYQGTAAGKYIGMGYPPGTVQLALAYQASLRTGAGAGSGGGEAAVIDFCNGYTQLLGMGFKPALAAGALVRAKNDATAAADLCLAAAAADGGS